MLVKRGPTIHKFANALVCRKHYFPLTSTLSPIGGKGKKWNRFRGARRRLPALCLPAGPAASSGRLGVQHFPVRRNRDRRPAGLPGQVYQSAGAGGPGPGQDRGGGESRRPARGQRRVYHSGEPASGRHRGPDPHGRGHLRRLPGRHHRPRQPALPVSLHQLHQLRPPVHHHPGGAL